MGKAKIFFSDKQKFGEGKSPVKKSAGPRPGGKAPVKIKQSPMKFKKTVSVIRKPGQSPKNIVKPGGNNAKLNNNNNNKVATAIQTAKAIAKSNHPKSKEIQQLLQTMDKGWIDNAKFMQILKPLIL